MEVKGREPANEIIEAQEITDDRIEAEQTQRKAEERIETEKTQELTDCRMETDETQKVTDAKHWNKRNRRRNRWKNGHSNHQK